MKITYRLLILFLSVFCLTLLSCEEDELEKSLEEILSKHINSKNFNYYIAPDDEMNFDTIFQERYITWLQNELDIKLTQKIKFYKFKDRAHLKELTGYETNAYAVYETFSIYSIWPIDNHECVHILVGNYDGILPSLFNEGIAVAYQAHLINDVFTPTWNGGNFHLISKDFLDKGIIPKLNKLLSNDTFWQLNTNVTYPVAGSFVRYLIDNYGLDQLKKFNSITNYYATEREIYENFNSIYSRPLVTAWLEWMDFLSDYK